MNHAMQAGVGEIISDWVNLLSKSELDKLAKSIREMSGEVVKAIGIVSEVGLQIEEYDGRKKEVARQFGFPSPLNPVSLIGWAPLVQAKKSIDAGIKRISALYLVFQNLSATYQQIAMSLRRAGLPSDAEIAFELVQALERWTVLANQKIYNKVPNSLDSRREIFSIFSEWLSMHGLRVTDNDKPGFYDSIEFAVKRYIGGEKGIPGGVPTTGMGVGPLVPVILGLIKVVVIVGGVIATLALVSSAISSAFGASNQAMSAALEFEKRKTARQKMVSEGKITQTEANALNEKDAVQLEKEVEDAAKLKPGLGLAGILLPVVIGAGVIGYFALKPKS